jgi:hypothetical protein
MKRYESSIPRVACSIGAVILTLITIGTLVVWPSLMEPENQSFVAVASANAVTATQLDAAD